MINDLQRQSVEEGGWKMKGGCIGGRDESHRKLEDYGAKNEEKYLLVSWTNLAY